MKTLNNLTLSKLILYSTFFISVFLATTKILQDNKDFYAADFRAYYTAGYILKNNNMQRLYDYQFQHETHQRIIEEKYPTIWFLNTPIVATIFIPLAYFDFETAYKIFAVINSLILIVAVVILSIKQKLDFKTTAVLSLYLPIISTLYHNQIVVLLLLIFALIFSYNQKNSIKTGVIAAFLFIKPQHLLFVPFLLLNQKTFVEGKKLLIGFVITLVVLVSTNLVIYGRNVYKDYWEFLNGRRDSLVQQEKYESYNLNSISKILDPYVRENITNKTLPLVEGVLILISLFLTYKFRDKVDQEILLSAALILELVLNIHTKYIDLVLLLIPMLIIIKKYIFELMTVKGITIVTYILIRQALFAITPNDIYIVQTLILLVIGIWLLFPVKVKKQIYS